MVTAVSSGSITIQLDGVNTGVQWTANYIGDVSNQSYQTQVNAIKALNSPCVSIPGSITLPIDFNISNWTDLSNNVISLNNGARFYSASNMTYTANFIGAPPFNTGDSSEFGNRL